MNCLVHVSSEGLADRRSKLPVLYCGLLLAEDLKSFIDGLRCFDGGIVQVTCNDKFPPGVFLMDTFGAPANLKRDVSSSRRRCSPLDCLGGTKCVEASVGGCALLPCKVFTVDVLGKLRFLCR